MGAQIPAAQTPDARTPDAERRLISTGQRTLTRAASRLRPVEGTLRALGSALGCWALLLDADRAAVAQAGAVPDRLDKVRELAAAVRGGTTRYGENGELGGTHLLVQQVEPLATRPDVLVVGRGKKFGVAEEAVVGTALALLGMLRRDVDTSRGHTARLATRLLLTNGGAAAESTGELLAQLLDNRASQHYRVLSGVDVRPHAPVNPSSDFDRLVQLLGTPLVDLTADGFRAIVAARSAPGPDRLETLHRRGWLVGMSGTATVTELRAAEREALALRRRASASGRPMRAEDGTDSVASLVEPERARAFARRRLAPLAGIRSPGGAQLVETLRVWLAHHGNWDRSAAVLGVHRNSVRHRIQQVEHALRVDLSEAQQRMDLWYAINWLPPDWPGED